MPVYDPKVYAQRLAIVRRLYPTTPARRIDRAQAWSYGTAAYIAKKEGLRHNPEVATEIYRLRCANCAKARTEEVQRRAIATRERRRKMDRLRTYMGEAPRMKYNYHALPVKMSKARWYLCKRYDYIPDERDPYVLYYDEQTHRLEGVNSMNHEARYAEQYHLRFLPLPADTTPSLIGGLESAAP